jgi:hypothetical protein
LYSDTDDDSDGDALCGASDFIYRLSPGAVNEAAHDPADAAAAASPHLSMFAEPPGSRFSLSMQLTDEENTVASESYLQDKAFGLMSM